MAVKTVYVCSNCGNTVKRWLGQCPECGEWNTFTEEFAEERKTPKGGQKTSSGAVARVSNLFEIDTVKEQRYLTEIPELDRVLGGGIVKGSVVLIGGEPGAGKSTLLLQMCGKIGGRANIFYFSGEESAHQIKIRADRMGIRSGNINISSETDIEKICNTVEVQHPDIVIIDSIQTMYLSGLTSSQGSVTQVRECTSMLQKTAKAMDIPVFIVGHVNKDGAIAGPKVMEHIVDTVLYFEGDKYLSYRVLRAAKNRFGSTNEIGIFDMQSDGLKSVLSPSEMLLDGRSLGVSGNCISCIMEGSRSMLVEIQSLAAKSAYNNARRTSSGIDYNRINLLMAVLEKRGGYVLSMLDIFVNVVGGLNIDDTSSDLALCMSLISSVTDRALPSNMIAFGEVGLSGEVRSVTNAVQRIKEAEIMGFSQVLLPQNNLRKLDQKDFNAELVGIRNLSDIKKYFQGLS